MAVWICTPPRQPSALVGMRRRVSTRLLLGGWDPARGGRKKPARLALFRALLLGFFGRHPSHRPGAPAVLRRDVAGHVARALSVRLSRRRTGIAPLECIPPVRVELPDR